MSETIFSPAHEFQRTTIRPTASLRGARARGVKIDEDRFSSRKRFCDTFTCGHCQTVVEVPKSALWLFKPRQVDDIGGYCERCGRMCCLKCSAKQTCSPLQRRLDTFLMSVGHPDGETFISRMLKLLRFV